MKKSSVFLVFLMILAAQSFAFDGNRKGFVLGGGLGIGHAKVSVDVSGADDLTNTGAAINFVIGYAWDEQNMIVFLRDGVIYSEKTIHGGSITLVQGFGGIGYYHYFGTAGKSGFITGGFGLQDWTSLDDDYESNDAGLGLLIGGGYEFTRHVQLYASLSFGKTSDPSFDYNHSQLMVTISAVAF